MKSNTNKNVIGSITIAVVNGATTTSQTNGIIDLSNLDDWTGFEPFYKTK